SFDGQGTQLLDGLYDTVGPEFCYFGGGTGNCLDFSNSRQMTERGLVSQGVSASSIRGCRMSAGVGHGWVPSGSPLVVTRAEGRVVFELDGRAALDVYAERLVGISSDSLAETFMRYPLGICYGPDRFIVRDPLRVFQDTALQFISDVPSQAVAYIMEPKPDPGYTMASSLSQKALGELAKPRFALISYCVSRVALLGSGYQAEIRSLVAPFGGQVPFLGLLASGEIGAYADVPQFHNKSISLLMGGE
ncbi:MAG: FIST C-terminal domain-containing protein, partial [Desulfuromonadaceae bacterium]|nr:FIST C-terminal domain-containing protein [Desulfuromonadaceae bacterium]